MTLLTLQSQQGLKQNFGINDVAILPSQLRIKRWSKEMEVGRDSATPPFIKIPPN